MGLLSKIADGLERVSGYVDGRTGNAPQTNSPTYREGYSNGQFVRCTEAARDEIDRRHLENLRNRRDR